LWVIGRSGVSVLFDGVKALIRTLALAAPARSTGAAADGSMRKWAAAWARSHAARTGASGHAAKD
jgi:hypothetical protein